MITERTLRQWRKDALNFSATLTKERLQFVGANDGEVLNTTILREQEYCNRILRLTQELLDIQLMRKG